jgi:enoyl-CoA hydratase/carnithine racemase
MIELRREQDVFILHMNSGENRFNEGFVSAVNRALDEVERFDGAAALVTTGEGKFYSNGLDLTWMMGPECGAPQAFVAQVQALLARLLTFPRTTVAAINGHAFAAGAMLALCHDFRVMRDDRGYFCLPEVDINIPFTPGMSALIQARLQPQVAHEACITGRRYGATDALANGIVSEACGEAEVLRQAVARGSALSGKSSATVGAIKRGLYAHVTASLLADVALSGLG